VIALLVGHGAAVYIPDENGETERDIARNLDLVFQSGARDLANLPPETRAERAERHQRIYRVMDRRATIEGLTGNTQSAKKALAAFGRPTLSIRFAKGEPSRARATQLGGSPLLRQASDWPACSTCNKPAMHTLRLELDELVGSGLTGMVQLFHCVHARRGAEPTFWVRYESSSEGLAPCAPPEGTTVMAPQQLAKLAKPATDLPTAFVRPLEQRWYPGSRNVAPLLVKQGDKVGGWPDAVEPLELPTCPDCATPMCLLLQLTAGHATKFLLGDHGRLFVFHCAKHPARLAPLAQLEGW
jgi:hypothetical protein